MVTRDTGPENTCVKLKIPVDQEKLVACRVYTIEIDYYGCGSEVMDFIKQF